MKTSDPNDDINRLRKKIDHLDDKWQRIFCERSEIARNIGTLKADNHCAFRPKREMLVLKKRLDQHKGWFPRISIVAIWREIFSASAWIHDEFRIALYAKPRCQLHLLDTIRFHYGFSAKLEWKETIEPMFQKLSARQITAAIIPLDLLLEQKTLPEDILVIEILPTITRYSDSLGKQEEQQSFLVLSYGDKETFLHDYRLFILEGNDGEQLQKIDSSIKILHQCGEKYLISLKEDQADMLYRQLTKKGYQLYLIGGHSEMLSL